MCEQYGRDALDIVAVYDNVDIADIILKRRLAHGNDVETVLFVSLSILACCVVDFVCFRLFLCQWKMLQSRFVCVSCVLREIRKCDCMDCVDSMCRVTLGTQEQ